MSGFVCVIYRLNSFESERVYICMQMGSKYTHAKLELSHKLRTILLMQKRVKRFCNGYSLEGIAITTMVQELYDTVFIW